MSTFSIDLTTQEITANFYIEGTTGGATIGTVGALNLDGNVSNVLRGDGSWGLGGGGGTANVAGTTGQIQYNNAGQLGAITAFSTNGSNISGAIANLKLTGGANGQFIKTDGSGNISFETIPGYVNIPRIELTSPSVATENPTFTSPWFAYYSDVSLLKIFKSGVLSDKDSWSLSGTTLSYIGWMAPTTQVDILPTTIATSSASITGDITVTSVTTGRVNSTGNVSASNVVASGNVTSSGVVQAAYLKGDGSNLTNIPGGAFISNSTTSVSTLATGRVETKLAGSLAMAVDTTGIEVFHSILPSANVTYDLGSPTRRFKDLYLSNNSIVLGDTTLSAPVGGGMSIDGSDIVTAQNDTLTIGNVVANYVSGNGSALSSITGANVVGNVGFAQLAFSVAGANVDGTVSTATEAFRVDGANVIGNVAVAEVALGVEGANVIGNVATALEAFSVDSSNVVGLGNIASANLTGEATQFFRGDGSFASFNPVSGATGEVQFNSGGYMAASSQFMFEDTTGLVLKRSNAAQTGLAIHSYDSTTTIGNHKDFMLNRSGGNASSPSALTNGSGLSAIVFNTYVNTKATYLSAITFGGQVDYPSDTSNTLVQSASWRITSGSRVTNNIETVENRIESVVHGSSGANSTAAQVFGHTGRHYQSVFSHSNNLATTTLIPDAKSSKARGFSSLEKKANGTIGITTSNVYPLQINDIAYRFNTVGYSGNGTLLDVNGASGYVTTGVQQWKITALPTSANAYFSTDYTVQVGNAVSNSIQELKFTSAGSLEVPSFRVSTGGGPASATDTGTAGQIKWDNQFIYVCTAPNTWVRAQLNTW